MRKALLLVLVAVMIALSGCSLFGGRVTFYTDGGGDSISGESTKGLSRGFAYRVDQLNLSPTCIPTIWAEDESGNRVPIQVQGEAPFLNVTPPEGSALQLSVEAIGQGEAVIETTDGAAQLPVVAYELYRYGGWHGIIVTAAASKTLTEVRAEAHFWLECRSTEEGGINAFEWKARIPAYVADPSGGLLGANLERIDAIKTVDAERFIDAPVEQWLETERIYVCRVPDGYVKISSTTQGLIWFFSPTPDFP